MKKFAKVLSCALCLLVVFTVVAFAAATSKSVDITTSQTVAKSETISAKSIKYSGQNHKISSRSLYVLPKYKNDAGKYVNGDSQETLLAPGGTCTNFYADVTFTSNKTWIIELNPYGVATSGCSGWGTITKNS
ncbi:MAG: hypothetical protein ACI4IF_07840 [Acutalibacteraceae bacterium]